MKVGGCAEHGDFCPKSMENWLRWMAAGGTAGVVYVIMRPGECVIDAKNRGSIEGVK